MKSRFSFITTGVFIAALLVVAACTSSGDPDPTGTPDPTVAALENGQSIYFYAVSSSGQFITYSGGPGTMMRLACVNCHGEQGHGGEIFFMMQSFDVPDITWAELTGQHEEHEPYTVATIKQAITDGLDPAGNELEYQMPQWQMSDKNLDDLILYLQSLE
ncbi:MAG: cytochrome c [Dehalogenimonas sp.]|uniref:Cytochrome c n=1 Tax=Candidatus Dehalogenimonas loeffleri TaxID=3127115 RepID=A0ABZ2J8B2_9CHLR|nr:cytochrome c [Dehalogenimonas sp.]